MHPCSVDTPSQIAAADAGRIPRTLLEAIRFYGDPDIATRALAAARWGESAECPHCHPRSATFAFRPAACGSAGVAGSSFHPRPARSSRSRRSVWTGGRLPSGWWPTPNSGSARTSCTGCWGSLKPPRSSCCAAFPWRWKPESPRAIGVRRFIRLLTDIAAVPKAAIYELDPGLRPKPGPLRARRRSRNSRREVERGFYGPDHPVQP